MWGRAQVDSDTALRGSGSSGDTDKREGPSVNDGVMREGSEHKGCVSPGEAQRSVRSDIRKVSWRQDQLHNL